MPNIKSAKKRVKVNSVKALNNQMRLLAAIRLKQLLLTRPLSRLSIRRLPSTSCTRTMRPTRRAR